MAVKRHPRRGRAFWPWRRRLHPDLGYRLRIDPSILPDLFEAFAQGDASIRRDHSGAGLGLALSGDLPPARVALDAEAA